MKALPMRDAQRNLIPFEAAAKIPMLALGGNGKGLLKVHMRLGKTISKPIFSLCRMMDAGAEFWLSKHGAYMQLGEEQVPVERVNDSLAVRVRAYDSPNEARADAHQLYVAGVAGDQKDDEDMQADDPGASSSGAA